MKFEFLGKLRDDGDSGGGGQQDGGGGQLPVEEVQRLTNQGYADSEITEELRDRGYTYRQINEAMNTAVRESAAQGGQNMAQQDDYGDGDQGFDDTGFNDSGDFGSGWESQDQGTQQAAPAGQPAAPANQQANFSQSPPPANDMGGDWSGGGVSPEEEELIEIIVSEHFAEAEDEFNKIYSEIEQLRNELNQLKDDFQEIDIRNDEDEQVVVQKVNEMEEYFEQTHSRMGGMEKALQQVLPALVENVRDLSSVVREMKAEQQHHKRKKKSR